MNHLALGWLITQEGLHIEAEPDRPYQTRIESLLQGHRTCLGLIAHSCWNTVGETETNILCVTEKALNKKHRARPCNGVDEQRKRNTREEEEQP